MATATAATIGALFSSIVLGQQLHAAALGSTENEKNKNCNFSNKQRQHQSSTRVIKKHAPISSLMILLPL
jgi:hypothetical protein